MSGPGVPDWSGSIDLSRAIGSDPGRVASGLGEPRADRKVGDERWLLFEAGDLLLRLRCRPGDGGGWRIASWTATWRPPRPSLRRATEPLGVWPVVAGEAPASSGRGRGPLPRGARGGDARAPSSGTPLLRYPLPDSEIGVTHSLTVLAGRRGFSRVAAFDEPPEWR